MRRRLLGRLAGSAPLLALLLVLVFFSSPFVRGWASLPVYAGEVSFSGRAAFEYLSALVSRFPGREPGTENARSSALWVEEEFRRMGLETSIEQFESHGVQMDLAEPEFTEEILALGRVSPNDLVRRYRGYNVVGVSPGEIRERIVIGAHRDVASTVEGAEDNASGTAVMLELARVLSSRPHRYTYVFVSFDAEEAGLLGSAHYAETHRNDPVLVAICLDMTGHRDAGCIWLYDYVTARGCAPLWTLALARSVMQAEGLPTHYFEAKSPGFPPAVRGEELAPPSEPEDQEGGPVSLFLKTLNERISGEWNTDSGSFIERGIPAIGVTAVPFDEKSGKVLATPIHTSEDSIVLMSPEVLEMSGRFVERYVESLNRAQSSLKGVLASRLFTRVPAGYLSPWALYSFAVLASALVLSVPVLRWASLSAEERESFGAYLWEEKLFLVLGGAVALAAAGVWQIYRLEATREIPFARILVTWFLTVLLGTAGLAVARGVRGRIARGRDRTIGLSGDAAPGEGQTSAERERVQSEKTVRPFRRLLLDAILGVLFVFECVALNFFLAIATVGIPLLFVNMLNATRGWKKVFHVLGLFVWTVVHLLTGVLALVPYGFSPGASGLFLTVLLHQAAWVYGVAWSFGPDGPARHSARQVTG